MGKNDCPILSLCGPKVHVVLRRLVVANALARLFMSCFIPKIGYRPLKLPLSCEVEKVFWGFGLPIRAFLYGAYFRACGRFWLSSVQRASRVAVEKRR